jgi:hypothetical protein
MAAGIQPTQAIINAQAGQLVLNCRNSLQQILFFNDYLNNLGQSGLIALGFSSGDATLLLDVYENMAAVASMCMGSAYTGPTLPFNFLAQTIPLWGGN